MGYWSKAQEGKRPEKLETKHSLSKTRVVGMFYELCACVCWKCMLKSEGSVLWKMEPHSVLHVDSSSLTTCHQLLPDKLILELLLVTIPLYCVNIISIFTLYLLTAVCCVNQTPFPFLETPTIALFCILLAFWFSSAKYLFYVKIFYTWIVCLNC